MRNGKYIFALIISLLVLTGCENNDKPDITDDKSNTIERPSIEKINTDNMTIIEHEHSQKRVGEENISLEEAAQIGVEYILTFFDFNFEGTYMELKHVAEIEFDEPLEAPIWIGIVSQSEQFDCENEAFQFRINAETGEWLSIADFNPYPITGFSACEIFEKTMEDLQIHIDEIRPQFPPPEEDEINEMLEVAKEYAQRHFKNNQLSYIEHPSGWGTEWGLGALVFIAEDEHEHRIHVRIQRETHHLTEIFIPAAD